MSKDEAIKTEPITPLLIKVTGDYIEGLEMKDVRKKPINVKAYKMDRPFEVDTLEGVMKGEAGDYLIIGIEGEAYPCKARIFEETYIEVSDEAVKSTVTDGSDSASFITSLESAKKGKIIAREQWSELGLTVVWVSGAGKGKRGYFNLINPKNPKAVNVWTPNEFDKKADDWCIVE